MTWRAPGQPKHRRRFEKLLFLAAKRGDTDLVAERLSWGIDPNCASAAGRTPLMANVRGYCPTAATVETLLSAGADASMTDHAGLTALDYARRKLLVRLQAHPPRAPTSVRRRSTRNDQLQLSSQEQAELGTPCTQTTVRRRRPGLLSHLVERTPTGRTPQVLTIRLRSRRIVEILENAGKNK